MKESTNRVCFVAGKSGGHIVPALALAERRRAENPDEMILFFSTDAALDKKIIGGSPLVNLHVQLPLGSLSHITRGYYLIKSFIQSVRILLKKRPDTVISMGGLVSVPVCLAARLLRIPVIIYELNATPGRAVLFLARFADEIRFCFEAARPLIKASNKTRFVYEPYPVRFKQSEKMAPELARKRLGLPETAHVLLILGGSQGSVFLNDFAKSFVEYYLAQTRNKSAKSPQEISQNKPLVILHQAGDRHIENFIAFYRKNNIEARVCAYQKDIGLWYAAADFVIARAGAGTLFELVFFGKKTLLIPLETATTDHQVDNAVAMAAQYPDLFTVARQETALNNNDLYETIFRRLQ